MFIGMPPAFSMTRMILGCISCTVDKQGLMKFLSIETGTEAFRFSSMLREASEIARSKAACPMMPV